MASGIGTNPVSVNQAAQYGDKTAIENLKRATTTTPSGNPAPRPTRGAPAAGPAPQGGAPAQPPLVPGEHQQMMGALAQAARTAYILNTKAQSVDAGPWLKYYAAVAAQRYNDLARRLKYGTPFFEGQ